MCGRATLAMVVSTICIMVAIITAPMITRGCFVTSAGPAARLLGTGPSRASSATVTLALACSRRIPADRIVDHHAFLRTEEFPRQFGIEILDHLDELAVTEAHQEKVFIIVGLARYVGGEGFRLDRDAVALGDHRMDHRGQTAGKNLRD